MRRDPELIRLLMLKLESLDMPATAIATISYREDLATEGYSDDQVYYHIEQILMNRWVDMAGGQRMNPSGHFTFRCLTPAGHDFVDSVRDDAIWALTKKGASEAGGFTLDTLAALGKGFLRKQIEKLTDIQLG
ncbi:TPA: DUF2513 domain-containing protein [Pseudomonas aeruginosa]|nr:DUF2513 domain-containing protein [Pseudomonas aeruginosa]HCE7546970.1 DUF2513 domain-containing protein [Pseudomonas aeruginosa]HCE7572827.1 DUF2513 domain-containing protein [Pseudomonas aeruginosa]HCE7846572.1 DUF2513 domain-containing protein [Pseudomonas aeruginosa]HCE7919465.1 DUF2513 domain-containing protein [Pseudomonas aeruginosa]